MKKYLRILSGVTAILISAGCTGVYALAQSNETSEEKAQTVSEKNSDNKETNTSAKKEKSDSSSQSQYKRESVYVIADSNGNKQKVVVSDWLKNPNGLTSLPDISNLTDIENVKTDEGYNASGSKLTWNTDGGDIYYKGYSNEELPIQVKVTYRLDGKEISPKQLAGKSGKLTIRYDYTNNAKKTVKIKGKNQDIFVPFLMATTSILDTDIFSNVEVTNGKIISDGNKEIFVGIALPGLTKSLGLNDKDNIDIPEYVELKADVKDFELATSITVATNQIFSDISFDKEDSIDDLKEKLNTLVDSTEQLAEGTSSLYKGITTLSDSSKELVSGTDKLYSGADKLNSGAKTLNSGASKLVAGGKTLDSST